MQLNMVALDRLPRTGDGQCLVIERRNLTSMVRRKNFDDNLSHR